MGSGPGSHQQEPRGRARQPERSSGAYRVNRLSLWGPLLQTCLLCLGKVSVVGGLIGGAHSRPQLEPAAWGHHLTWSLLGEGGTVRTARQAWAQQDGHCTLLMAPRWDGSLRWCTEVCRVPGAPCPSPVSWWSCVPVCHGTTPGLVRMGLQVQGRGAPFSRSGGVARVGTDLPPHSVCQGLGACAHCAGTDQIGATSACVWLSSQ